MTQLDAWDLVIQRLMERAGKAGSPPGLLPEALEEGLLSEIIAGLPREVHVALLSEPNEIWRWTVRALAGASKEPLPDRPGEG